tara:strand:+ start:970 stop:1671 length:702 start_codon:yes stop_codon:yes gene_type:complete
MSDIIFKRSPLGEIKDLEDKSMIISGYGSYFDNIDADGDIIRKGAYKKTIEENGSRVKYLYQHKMDQPIGKMEELYEDEKGLVFVARLADTTLGRDVYTLMKEGIITENSVGILPIQKENKEGAREMLEVKLFEISAVTLASNEEAKILDVKSNQIILDDTLKRYDQLCKVIRKGNISDELGYAIESEILKLKSLFAQTTQPAEIVTEPEIIKEVNNDEIINYLYNRVKNSKN